MGYYDDLCRLLRPLGVYRLDGESVSGAELAAAGAALDGVAERLECAVRDGLVTTAEEEGLSRWECLLRVRPVSDGTELRRQALRSLLAIGPAGATAEALERTISGCGITAHVTETGVNACRVSFPGTVGVPEAFAAIRKAVERILPCQLAVDYAFRFQTWAECEAMGRTWADAAEYTWDAFEKAICT